MKFLSILLIAIFGLTTTGYAQLDAIEKYFDKYVDDEKFTVVYVSPKMFQMVTKVVGDEVDENVLDIVKDLKGLRILTTEDTSKDYYKEATSVINTKEYEVLMTVRDKGENVRFLTKDNGGDIIHELLLLVGGESEFVMLSFVGNIDLNKIAKLAKNLDIDGAEHLEKLKDKGDSKN